MKKALLCTLFGMGLFTSLSAQTSEDRNGITYKFLGLDYAAPISSDYFKLDQMTYGAEIGYFRHLNSSLNVGFPLRIGVVDFPSIASNLTTGVEKNKMMASLDAVLQYKFNNGYILKEQSWFAPYIFAGVGGKYIDRSVAATGDKFDFEVPVGLGFNFRLAKGFSVQLQSEYRKSFMRERDNLVHSLGFLFAFGGQMADQDKDGIEDSKDACPTVAGPKELMGCPDTDKDGVLDKDDKCPTTVGSKDMKGCPDTDKDGVSDSDDACPQIPGLAKFNGCPDADGDGVEDSKDECPKKAGLVEFNGCPDSDGDGVADSKDACPNEKGAVSNNGCPVKDADGDGIADNEDACPNKAGLARFRGCPDTDGDGIADNEDRCPSVPGVASRKGCPDEIKAEEKQVLQQAEGVQFETSSAKIKTISYSSLDKVVALLNSNSQIHLSIEGHTDSQGDDAKNQTLSENRAKACFDYLTSKGISAGRLTHVGFGESRPKADNTTPAGRAINRRVEFIPTYK